MTTVVRMQPHEAWTFCRLPTLIAEHHISAKCAVHVGAHHGEEVPTYRQCGFTNIHLYEPDPRSVAILHDLFDDDIDVHIFPWAVVPDPLPGQALLHFAERTVWTGLKPHPTANGTGTMVSTVPIASLFHDVGTVTLLVLDTQGSELDLLRAAPLDGLDMVIVETSHHERLGAICANYDQAEAHMRAKGWRVVEEWDHDGSGYTDTVFIHA